ncbi:MHS family MFS transporter [Pseudomonas syringae pv. actinidiae]|nr:MHS family MFS transporter [Pseudomonas syringae pv. actinidiae]
MLPTYASIGVMAPILLTIIRCAQGFSAGGEYAGACAYLMEHAPRTQRAWYGSFVPVSTFSAFAAAAVVAYALESSLSTEAMGQLGLAPAVSDRRPRWDWSACTCAGNSTRPRRFRRRLKGTP